MLLPVLNLIYLNTVVQFNLTEGYMLILLFYTQVSFNFKINNGIVASTLFGGTYM